MYQFRDVFEFKQPVNQRLSEAFTINGVYLEDFVEGYHTLYASGRESLEAELNVYSSGIRDGEYIASRHFPAREITIGFQLIAKNNAEFRRAFNTLNRLLDVQEAEVIFDDENDKFFRGTPLFNCEVDPGKNAVTGEYTIYCADPVKYSVIEYVADTALEEIENDDGTISMVPTFTVNYDGTYKSYPRIETTLGSREAENENDGYSSAGDAGYLAFVNDEGKILLLGNESEEDITSRTAFNKAFTGLWSGTFTQVLNNLFKREGSMKVGEISGTKCAAVSSYGSTTSNVYHGPTMGYRIDKVDAQGVKGAKDFSLSWKQRLALSNSKNANKQKGAFSILLTDENNQLIAAVAISKNSNTTKGGVYLYVGKGSNCHNWASVDLGYNNTRFGYKKAKTKKNPKPASPILTSSIKKEGDKFTFNIGGLTFTTTGIGACGQDLTNRRVVNVIFQFCKYGSAAGFGTNALYSAQMIDTAYDQVNKFTSADVVEADCSSAEIYVNGERRPDLGALGNDWEEFYLEPYATNKIGCAWSNWTEIPPVNRLYYRKAYL